MHTITLHISEDAMRKMRQAYTVKLLMGSAHDSTADVVMARILAALEENSSTCTLQTNEERT